MCAPEHLDQTKYIAITKYTKYVHFTIYTTRVQQW